MNIFTKICKAISLFFTLVLLLLFFAQIYVLNSSTALCRDDYSYSYTFAVKENKFKITNFKEVIESQINHYRVVNGRAVTHTIAQTFLIFDKSVFNFFNSVAFILLSVILCKLAAPKSKSRFRFYFLASYFLLWFFTPAFGDDYLWLTGACNYLWGILIIFTYVLYVTRYKKSTSRHAVVRIAHAVFCFVFSIVAGFTNENTAAALIAMSFLYVCVLAVSVRRFPTFEFIGLVGNICGFLLMILAPGQNVRLDANGGFGSIRTWVERAAVISSEFFKYHKWLMFAALVLVLIAILRKVSIKLLIRPMIFSVGTLVSVYSMILSPYFPTRVWSGPTILFTLTLISLFDAVLPRMTGPVAGTLFHFAVTLVTVVVLIFYIPDYFKAYNDVSTTKLAVEQRIEVIENSKANGQTRVELKSISGNSRFDPYVPAGDLNDDSSTWPNTAVAMYFDLDEVIKAVD